ncbi:MAG TPA: rhodanese-like domain-containing protein [Terriglobia bacterium]|nr:rhodanese-like domain-containing protein [Terriglobia bacterium]
MATLLSKIFGKKTPTTPAPEVDQLDVSALKPLMQPKAAVSTDPKDLSGAWTMQQVTTVFPSAQRALFQRYHVGGCSSCGFQPTDLLATVAMNHGLDVNELVEHIKRSQEMEKDLEITARETAELLNGGKIKLVDVRTPEEFAIASVPGSVLVDQSLAQEIMQTWPKDTAIVTMCHHGMRSLDAAAYLRGHGFTNAKSMSGGIDAWSLQIDSSIPRY